MHRVSRTGTVDRGGMAQFHSCTVSNILVYTKSNHLEQLGHKYEVLKDIENDRVVQYCLWRESSLVPGSGPPWLSSRLVHPVTRAHGCTISSNNKLCIIANTVVLCLLVYLVLHQQRHWPTPLTEEVLLRARSGRGLGRCVTLR